MKLPGGIVGKTCYVLMAVCGTLAAIVAAIRTEAVGYAAIATLLIIVIWGLRRLFQFADANPDVAMMEGAEIIAFRRMQFAQKGVGTLPDSTPESSEPDAKPLPAAEQAAIPLPDPLQLEQPKPKRAKSNG